MRDLKKSKILNKMKTNNNIKKSLITVDSRDFAVLVLLELKVAFKGKIKVGQE